MTKFRRRGPRHRWGHVVWGFVVLQTIVTAVLGDANFNDLYFTVEPSDVIVLKDQSAVLNCSAAGHPTPTIEWRREGLFLNFAGDTRQSILSNGSLYFKSVHHTRTERPDEGIYQCVATVDNVGTIVSRAAKLQVASLPRFDEQPQSVTVFPGQTVRFSCSVQGVPPAHVQWLKDEQPFKIDESRMVVLPSGALEIDHVNINDQGQYRCNASNIEKHRLSDTGTLTVSLDTTQANKISAPQFIATPKSVIVVEGSNVTLDCAANGNPRPHITWLKDGATIDMADLDSRFSLVGTGSLQIVHLQEADEGNYMCRAENYEDSVDSSASLEIQVPPRFIKRPLNRYAHEKEDIEFDCQIYGKPEPTIQWVKNGDLIIESEYFQIVNGNNLKILGLVSSDVGFYQCFGINPAGNIQATAQLMVLKPDVPLPTTSITTPNIDDALGRSPLPKDVPDAPQDLTAVIVSTRFVTLSWREPAVTNGEIIAYSVYYRQENSDRERVINTTRSRLEEVNIQGLRPSSTYFFRVLAYNEHGPGQSSEELSVETQPEVHVPGPSTNLRAVAILPSSIHVQWDPPDQRNGPIQRYKLYYMEVGTSEEHETQTIESFYILRGLKKYTEYTFWVVAYNQNGPGMSTDEVVTRTHSDVPSETPQNVTLEAASSTSIIVRWEPPPKGSQNGVITGYKIRYKQKGSRRGDTRTTDGNRRLYALTGLERGAEYSVRMSALTVNGSGPVTDWMTIETYQNDLDESRVPDPPSSLKARPNINSISVSWTPPRNQNIMVRGYTIGWGVGIPDVYTKVLDGKQRFYTIENLQPSSEYVISLRAYNQMGDGRPIYETVKTRIETTPEPLTPMLPPVGLKAIVLSATSVVLYWTDTTLPRNQVINDNRYYTIRYAPYYSSNPKYKYFNATELNCMIDDLKPNTQYEFVVKVTKGRRDSTWSLSVLNMTQESAPSSPPRDLTVVAVENNPTSINLSWQPPKQPNGQITGYVIFYNTDPNQRDRDWVVEGIVGDKMTTTIRGLTPDTKYYFKIQARNNKGYGPLSQAVIFQTSPSNGLEKESTSMRADSQGIAYSTLYIIIACVLCGIVLFIVIGVSIVICRRRRGDIIEHKKKGYGVGKGKTDVKPPDLWIHHDQMELKQMEKSQTSETSTSVTPMTRNSQDYEPDEKPSRDTLEKRGAAYIGDSHSDESSKASDKMLLTRRPMRPKPIMIPVDAQHPPPREPIATATPIPNGSLNQHGDRDVQTGRPIYPRTQYNIPRAHVTIDSPQPGSASVRPQQQQASSPYKKAGCLSTSTPSAAPSVSTLKSRAALPVVAPRAPEVPYKTGREEELAPSYSTEELNAEMANLEGLMKDLNAITASEFEC